MWNELLDHRIDRRPGFDHQDNHPWAVQGIDQLVVGARRSYVLVGRLAVDELLGQGVRPVVDGDLVV